MKFFILFMLTAFGGSDPAQPDCAATDLVLQFSGDADAVWRSRLVAAAERASRVLATDEFKAKCNRLKLSRTNGKTVAQVCDEVACSGKQTITIGFFHKENTKAIASEGEDTIFINTAKEDGGAGSPGNLVHEFTHALGYTHFTNFPIFGKNSVPYKIGNLVDELTDDE